MDYRNRCVIRLLLPATFPPFHAVKRGFKALELRGARITPATRETLSISENTGVTDN